MIKHFKALSSLRSQYPIYLIYWVTSICNARCVHCFNWQEIEMKPNDLKLDEIQKFSEKYGKIKFMTLAGGEPTIRKDLGELTELFYKNNNLEIATMVTHGYFTDKILNTTDYLLTRCPKLFINWGISLDAMKEKHDAMRKLKDCFDRAIRTLQELKKNYGSNPRVHMNVVGTFTSINQDEFRELTCYIQDDLKIPFNINLVRGDPKVPSTKQGVNTALFRQAAQEVHEKNRTMYKPGYPFKRVREAIDEMTSEIAVNTFDSPREYVPCHVGRKQITISSEGHVLLCEILMEKLGSLRDYNYDLKAILDLESTQKRLTRVREEKCHCTWECIIRNNITFSPKMYPEVLWRVAKRALS